MKNILFLCLFLSYFTQNLYAQKNMKNITQQIKEKYTDFNTCKVEGKNESTFWYQTHKPVVSTTNYKLYCTKDIIKMDMNKDMGISIDPNGGQQTLFAEKNKGGQITTKSILRDFDIKYNKNDWNEIIESHAVELPILPLLFEEKTTQTYLNYFLEDKTTEKAIVEETIYEGKICYKFTINEIQYAPKREPNEEEKQFIKETKELLEKLNKPTHLETEEEYRKWKLHGGEKIYTSIFFFEKESLLLIYCETEKIDKTTKTRLFTKMNFDFKFNVDISKEIEKK